jgi:CHASE3 domain sensor protein
MDQLLIDTIIDKLDLNEKRLDQNEEHLAEIDQTLIGISDQTENLKKVAAIVKRLQDSMMEVKWPVDEINKMSFRLNINNGLLANPVKTKQTVVHNLGNLLWLITGLSAIVISLSLWLINITERMDQYKTNDLLWRYIKVTANSQYREYLQTLEQGHAEDPDKMKSFVDQEELNQKQVAESETGNQIQNPPDSVLSTSKKKEKRKH